MVAATKKFGNVGKRKGATVRDVPANKWCKAVAQQLKREGKIFVPTCSDLTKTSHGRERAPQSNDWYYMRCASVMRRIYVRPGTGYGGLSKAYGNLKNRGCKPERTIRAATGPLHWACKSLEGLKLITKGKGKGRVMTPAGKKLADTVAFNVKIHRMAPNSKKAKKA